MKKIVLLIFIISLSLNTFAQYSSLTIFSEDGNPFYVILNGIRQNETAETNVRIDNLINEYYTLKLIFDNENIPTIEKKILMVVDANAQKGEATYKIKKNKKGNLVLRFFSFTPYAKVLPAPANVAVVHYNTKPMPLIVFGSSITSTTTSTTTTNPNTVNANVNVGGVNMGISVNDNFDSQTSTTTTTTTTTISHYENSSPIIVEEEIGCLPMNNSSFQNALKSIESQSFSDSKMTQAKQIARSNCLTSKQIKEFCKLFSFDDDRLEFAKFAYNYCVDTNNYWEINSVFKFTSNSDELNEFIQSK